MNQPLHMPPSLHVCLNVRCTQTKSILLTSNSVKNYLCASKWLFSLSLIYLLFFKAFIIELKTQRVKEDITDSLLFLAAITLSRCFYGPHLDLHQPTCEPGNFLQLHLKLPCGMATPTPHQFSPGQLLHGVSSFKRVPISCVAFITNMNSSVGLGYF